MLQADGTIDPGLYVVGWAKRGPTGIIGKISQHHRATMFSSFDAQIVLPDRGASSKKGLSGQG